MPIGTLDVSSAPPESEAMIVWSGRGGPPVSPPTGPSGFGSKLLVRGLAQIGGSINRFWRTDGVVGSMRIAWTASRRETPDARHQDGGMWTTCERCTPTGIAGRGLGRLRGPPRVRAVEGLLSHARGTPRWAPRGRRRGRRLLPRGTVRMPHPPRARQRTVSGRDALGLPVVPTGPAAPVPVVRLQPITLHGCALLVDDENSCA